MSSDSILDIKNVIQDTKPNTGLKRLQVPRACVQCRKSHAGCDLERPCKRCRQNGMETLCGDMPRKKRESKQKRTAEGTDDDWLLISTVSSPNMLTMPKKDDDWDQYAEVFGLSSPNMNHVTSHEFISRMPQSSASAARGANGNNHIVPSMLHTFYQTSNMPSSLSEHLNYTPTYHYTTNLNNVSVNVSGNENFGNLNDLSSDSSQPTPPSVHAHTPLTNISSSELSYLMLQIKELKESNKVLEVRLQSVTKELVDLKRQKANHLQSISMLTNWHSFVPQADLAISVWKSTQTKGKNVLVECNDKFIQLLGYPVEVLKNGFTSHKLMPHKNNADGGYSNEFWPDEDDGANVREWPKKTQMVTAQGVRDVYITVNPVPDHFSDSKYWIVHMLPVQMT